MPLEIDSPAKTVVNARPHVNHARRARADQQVSTGSDFYEQLLRFQTPEVTPPVSSEPKRPAEPPVESKSKPQETAEGEAEETREPEQDEPVKEESQSSAAAVAPTVSDRALDQEAVVKAKKTNQDDNEVRTADNSGNQDSSDSDKKETNVTIKADTRVQQDIGRDSNVPQTEKARQKKADVVATRNDNQDARNQEAKAQQDQRVEDTRSVEPTISIKAEEKAARDPNQEQKIADAAVEKTQDLVDETHIKEIDALEHANVRLDDKKRPGLDRDANTNSQATPSETLDAAMKGAVAEKPIDRKADDPIAETNNTATEPLRPKRRTDRNSSRNRGNNDASREPSDRPLSNDRALNSKVDSASATVTREIATARSTDTASVAAFNPAAASTAASSSVSVPSPVQTASPTFAPTSTSTASTDTRAAQGISRADSSMQGSPAVAVSSASPSDSTSSRGAAATAGSTGTRMTQYQETKLVQRVLRGMEQLSNGGGQVRLRLHPPELGSLQMSLRIEGNTVFAEMKVETTAARDALMKNLPVLKDRLAEQGMQVQHFEVQTDSNFDGGNSQGGNFSPNSQSSQNGNDTNSNRANSRYVSELQNRLPNQEIGGGPETIRRWTRTLGQLDFEA
jgi:flagellar hook-length control protein FliK